jgi:hypothetical protein
MVVGFTTIGHALIYKLINIQGIDNQSIIRGVRVMVFIATFNNISVI